MKCLIVEDDPILCETLADCLSENRIDYKVAHSVADGTHALRQEKFDLILLDYNLPDGTSTDLSTIGAMLHPNCRIIMLTGSPVFPTGEHAHLAPGIDWVLRKPASLDDIEALLSYAKHDVEANPTQAFALP